MEFFAASTDEAAAAVVDRGPGPDFETLDCGIFDVIGAMIAWESFFTGRSVRDLIGADEPRVVADPCDGGPVVFAASKPLQHALTVADQSRISEVADLWVRELAVQDEVFEPAAAVAVLTGLAHLARTAAVKDDRLYCWLA